METRRSPNLSVRDARTRSPLMSERRNSKTFKNPQDFPNHRRRRSSNLSDIYKNPQIYAGMPQNDTETPWSTWKKCLFLTPAFGYQMCTVFTSVFSVVNMRMLQIPKALSSLQLVIGGCLGILLILIVQRRVKKYYGERRHSVKLFVSFTLYLLLGMILVLVPNMAQIFYYSDYVDTGGNSTWSNSTGHPIPFSTVSNGEHQTTQISGEYEVNIRTTENTDNLTTLSIPTQPDFTYVQNLVNVPSSHVSVPSWCKALAFVGYVIMASSLSSGYYLLLSIVMSLTSKDDTSYFSNSIRIVVTASSLGGCTVCLLGAIDLTSNWNPTEDGKYHVYVQIFNLLCIALVILLGCTACCLVTWYGDAIKKAFSQKREDTIDSMAPRDRRPTRTAQEIFDECAPLLGLLRTPNTDDSNSRSTYLSPNPNTEDQTSLTESYSETIEESAFSTQPDLIRQYSYPVPTIDSIRKSRSWISRLKAQKSMILATLLHLFLSSSWVTVEYYSSIYLSFAAYDPLEGNGHSFRKGLRVASAGLFIMYLVFSAVYVSFERIPPQVGWKRLGLGIGILASILTLSLALINKVGLYFAVVGIQGALRVVVLSLPQMLTACTISSQTGFQTSTIKHLIIDTPTTILWCMLPLSLTVASGIITPLVNATDCHETPLYFSAVSALLGSVGLIALLGN